MSVTELQSVQSTRHDQGHLGVRQGRAAVQARPAFIPARASVALASSRAFASNPNHHLWKNGRLWWIAFTLIHDGWRQERVRQSLGTDNQLEARRRRDAILSLFGGAAGDGCLDPEPECQAN